jgi:NADPH:quinone reductase-like Zn-dependent oxidoreductase
VKAIVHDAYGPPDVLELREIDTPRPKDGEVLVRVHAAALHAGDRFGLRGQPLPIRLATGLLKPRNGVPGYDVAGHVEAIGRNVKRFRPGDEVFGARARDRAPSTCVREKTGSRRNRPASPSSRRRPCRPRRSPLCALFAMWAK